MHVAFSPDGKHILTNREDQTAQVWEVATGKEERSFEGSNFSGAFSPDGRYVLIGGSPNAILWDLESGQEVRRFRGHEWRISSVAFSADGKTAITGSWDHTAKLWDVATGKQLTSFEGHTASVTSVVFSADGRHVITGSEDSTTRFWDVSSGSVIATLMSFNDKRWAVVDNVGRFDTNLLDGGAPLAWVVASDPLRAMPLSIFTRDYFSPGLLARLLKDEKLPAVRSISEIKNRLQPIVSIESVKLTSMSPPLLEVTVQARSYVDKNGLSSGLQDLHLFRDGQLLPNGIKQGILRDGRYVFSGIQVKRAARSVAFSVYAFNSERIESATISSDSTLTYELPAPAELVTVKPKALLLQVGVNHTSARGCELKYSVNDAETMSAALSDKLKAQGFEIVPVKLESAAGSDTGGAAKQLIRTKLDEMAAKATPDDVLFMSFSGHGFSAAGGAFYILPSSLQGDCAHVDDAMLKTAISADELAEWLRPIDAGEMTLILDACYSAESVQAGDFKPGPMGSRGLGQLAYDKRMRVLAASQSDAVAHEYDYLHQGLLSYVLVKDGLEKDRADWKPKDGKITVGEWLSYATAAVPEFKPSAPTGENKGTTIDKTSAVSKTIGQVPALFDFSHEDTLVLVK